LFQSLLKRIHNLYRYTSEGWKNAAGDDYVPNEEQDAALLRELASAVGRDAKKQRQREVEDILYLHVVHRFNNLGVPLAPNPAHYRGPALAVGLYKLNPVFTPSLKAPGFNP
jgi:hypothetical protein